MKNIRVLHCIASIEPSYGGPVPALRGLVNALTALGVQVTILTSSCGNKEKDQLHAKTFKNIPVLWFNPQIRRYYWDSSLKSVIQKEIKNFDLLHIHGVFNGLSSSACVVARQHKVPYVIEPFGTLSSYCLKKSSFLKKAALFLGEKKNIESARGISFTSENELKNVSENFKIKNGFVVFNGLDWSEFENLPLDGEFRKSQGLGAKDGLIVFLGRLHPIKGLEPFIREFTHWRQSQRIGWHFVMVGPDEAGYQKKLQKIISDINANDFVHFVGPLYGAARLSALKDSSFCALPSYYESFGLSAVEAMACKKPVLVSEGVDISPYVKAHRMGEVASLRADGFYEALERMTRQEALWNQMGERAHLWAKSNCDWNKGSEIVLEKYKKILA